METDVIASVNTVSDSYNNTFAEMVEGLYKYEVIDCLEENGDGINDVELATLERVAWFNKTRLHSTIYSVSPFEFKEQYYDNLSCQI